MAKNKRFEKVYSQGVGNVTEIWVDKDGKPVVSPRGDGWKDTWY